LEERPRDLCHVKAELYAAVACLYCSGFRSNFCLHSSEQKLYFCP